MKTLPTPTPHYTNEPESTSEDSTNLLELNIKASDSLSDDTETQHANTPNTITIDDSSNGTITIEDNSNQNQESDLEIISSKESGYITDSSVTEIQNNVESREESLNSQEASAPPIPLEPEIVVQQESLSKSEDDDYQIPFFPRRSTRSTRGAPPSRYGNVVSHSVGPKYPDFEFCGI